MNPKTYRHQYKELVKKNGVPFWPDAAWRDALFGSLVIAGIVTFAFVYGAPHLAPPPNPTLLNAEPRPDWYLLWYFAILAMSPHQTRIRNHDPGAGHRLRFHVCVAILLQ